MIDVATDVACCGGSFLGLSNSILVSDEKWLALPAGQLYSMLSILSTITLVFFAS
jgi:hypothetical protein